MKRVAFYLEAGIWTGGPQQTSMNVMRNCTLMEVSRIVRRVVTGQRLTRIEDGRQRKSGRDF